MCSSEGDSEYSEVEDEDEMKMVLIVRNDLKMGKGKVSHLLIYIISTYMSSYQAYMIYKLHYILIFFPVLSLNHLIII